MNKVIQTQAPVGEITSAGHRRFLVGELLSALIKIDDRCHHRNDKIDETAAIFAEAAAWGIEYDLVLAYGRAMADQAKEDARRHMPRTEINGMPIVEMRRITEGQWICAVDRSTVKDVCHPRWREGGRTFCVVKWDGIGDSWHYAIEYDLTRDEAVKLLRERVETR
tara:strand:- start:20400 stop:20897 length:498 start_codon:yes stop_codon:yes gene_type:complete